MSPGPQTMSLSSPKNLADDFVNSITVRYNQAYNRRPLWSLHISVDKVSFIIGAVGSVIVGYALRQYEPMNIDNVNYIDTGEDSRFLGEIINETISHPLAIVERFFLGGAIYVGIGLLTEGVLRVTKPALCGCLTGFYFSYGYPISSTIKATVGFALFAIAVEGIFYILTKD